MIGILVGCALALGGSAFYAGVHFGQSLYDRLERPPRRTVKPRPATW